MAVGRMRGQSSTGLRYPESDSIWEQEIKDVENCPEIPRRRRVLRQHKYRRTCITLYTQPAGYTLAGSAVLHRLIF